MGGTAKCALRALLDSAFKNAASCSRDIREIAFCTKLSAPSPVGNIKRLVKLPVSVMLFSATRFIIGNGSIRLLSSLSQAFGAGHFKKFEVFLFGPEIRNAGMQIHPIKTFFREADSPYLQFLFDFINDHAARLIIRERLRMITVTRVHPHTWWVRLHAPRLFDGAG